MPAPASPSYVVDSEDPRAPSKDIWDRMSTADRDRVLESLPSEFPVSEASPPEGDLHYEAVERTREMLRGYFRRIRRRIYIGNNLPVYYPGERMFSPDVLAVLEVEDRPRNGWVVSAEDKGLDLAMEIHWRPRAAKDFERNRQHYAQLGITEYFIFDVQRLRLRGYELPDGSARVYRPILAQSSRFSSSVLGLDIGIDGDKLRFYHGTAPLPDAEELRARLDATIEKLSAQAEQEAQRAEQEAQRAQEAERKLAEAIAEIEVLRKRVGGE